MRLIDADALGNRMYHESFEKDSDLQKWDSGCWIRYKLFEQVLRAAPTIDLTHPTSSNTLGALDCVDRAEVIKAVKFYETFCDPYPRVIEALEELPSVQPTTLTEDDKETIRIHLSAFKERLCNQCRWNEAKEYEELISRFLSTPSVQPRKGEWAGKGDSEGFGIFICDNCGKFAMMEYDFCPNCGADMRERDDER